jgi:hypothetical protein
MATQRATALRMALRSRFLAVGLPGAPVLGELQGFVRRDKTLPPTGGTCEHERYAAMRRARWQPRFEERRPSGRWDG